MVSTSRAGLVAIGSYSTVAEPVIRLTFTALTPGVASNLRCTVPLQPAQVMPETGMVQVSDVAVLMISNRVNGKQ
jgi:hypothetical protein